MSIQKKILSPKQLKAKIKSLRRKKIVFTNGCFDLLHPGHVLYLEKAAKLGTHLVVALNSDDSVKRLKGPTRPINSLNDRAQVIAALESVAFVTSFSDDTPLELIKLLVPQVLVKGGDYEIKKIVGYDVVKAAGGTVKTIRFVDGKSTTLLINKLAKT